MFIMLVSPHDSVYGVLLNVIWLPRFPTMIKHFVAIITFQQNLIKTTLLGNCWISLRNTAQNNWSMVLYPASKRLLTSFFTKNTIWYILYVALQTYEVTLASSAWFVTYRCKLCLIKFFIFWLLTSKYILSKLQFLLCSVGKKRLFSKLSTQKMSKTFTINYYAKR